MPIDCAILELGGSTDGMIKYFNPMREKITLRIEGTTPQYQAQKAIVGKRVTYGTLSPRNGLSAIRMNKAPTVAKNAITKGAEMLLEIRAETKLAVAIGPPPPRNLQVIVDFTKLTLTTNNPFCRYVMVPTDPKVDWPHYSNALVSVAYALYINSQQSYTLGPHGRSASRLQTTLRRLSPSVATRFQMRPERVPEEKGSDNNLNSSP
jgi:hypothetical protein